MIGTPQRPFVQILNVNDHWITASNVFCGSNEVCIYDSLNVNINQNREQKLSWLIQPQAPQFLIRKPSVQIQQSGSSCGPYALAFASVLCEGVIPEECYFKEKNMRQILYRALKTKMAKVFPYEKKPSKPERTTVQVDVYCVCRTSRYREVMVQCCECSTWYHPTCVSVPHKVLNNAEEEWKCEICTN